MFHVKKTLELLALNRFLPTSRFLRRSLWFSTCSSQDLATSREPNLKQRLTNIRDDGLTLKDFVDKSQNFFDPYVVSNRSPHPPPTPYLSDEDLRGNGRTVFIETYGCQMNVNDTQLAQTILKDAGYHIIDSNDPRATKTADVHLLMTCSIRDGAEQKIWNRLDQIHSKNALQNRRPQIGLLGCMAERLKANLISRRSSSNGDRLVDIVCGPDAYRDLPKLLAINSLTGQSAVNVLLSLDETYSDVLPVNETTLGPTKKTAFISIMRGCDNVRYLLIYYFCINSNF